MEIKSGKKTSELYVSIISIIILLVPALTGMISADTKAIVIGIIACAYVIGRVIVKKTATKNDDKIVDALGLLVDKLESKKN